MNIEWVKQKLFEALSCCSFFEQLNVESGGINENTSLINGLKIESIQLLEYIIQIEKHLEKTIDFDDLSIESLDTICGLAAELMRPGVLA
ncbi:MAG: acyl carrier protein [Clostridia bacterium]|nr:acyl carrier protein [Clostridia bacterium]